jgi:hypothetical protein
MKPLTNLVRERQLRYLGHVLRLGSKKLKRNPDELEKKRDEPARKFAFFCPSHGRRKWSL